jgi:hypothetical protein
MHLIVVEWQAGFEACPVNVGFVGNQVGMEQVFLRELQSSPVGTNTLLLLNRLKRYKSL